MPRERTMLDPSPWFVTLELYKSCVGGNELRRPNRRECQLWSKAQARWVKVRYC